MIINCGINVTIGEKGMMKNLAAKQIYRLEMVEVYAGGWRAITKISKVTNKIYIVKNARIVQN